MAIFNSFLLVYQRVNHQTPPETQLLRGDFGEQERQVLRHRVWLVGGGEEPIGLQTPEKTRTTGPHTPKL